MGDVVEMQSNGRKLVDNAVAHLKDMREQIEGAMLLTITKDGTISLLVGTNQDVVMKLLVYSDILVKDLVRGEIGPV